jgi:hypothetical protein
VSEMIDGDVWREICCLFFVLFGGWGLRMGKTEVVVVMLDDLEMVEVLLNDLEFGFPRVC